MGASMVKSCFATDGYPSPTSRPPCSHHHHHHQHHHHQRHPKLHPVTPLHTPHRPAHATHALESYHGAPPPPPRKLSPYDRFRQELQLRSAALPFKNDPRRERYDSRESTSSSGTDEELAAMMIMSRSSNQVYDKDRRLRGSSRRSPAHLASYASTAPSGDSFCRTPGSRRSSGVVTPASSRRLSRTSSPSFGFEDLLPEHYVLEELIGSGTTSKCYRCRRTTDGRAFACKIINKRRLSFDQFQRDDMVTQVRKEVEVLRRLDHPNIAKLEDAYENNTYILLMMELLEGGELFDTIIERVRFTESDAKETARSILSAIAYMHSQGIVHRDIKPENLLLAAHSSPGKPLLVKIVDFGFASSIHSRGAMTSFLGTGGYIAPEIVTHQPYTAAVDTWAFGVLLYLMLCGRLPFTTAIQLQPGQRMSSVYRLTFPDKYWHGVSSTARDLVSKLLVLNPSQRLTPAEALQHRWFRAE